MSYSIELEGFVYLYSSRGESQLRPRGVIFVLVVITVYCFQGVCGCWLSHREHVANLAKSPSFTELVFHLCVQCVANHVLDGAVNVIHHCYYYSWCCWSPGSADRHAWVCHRRHIWPRWTDQHSRSVTYLFIQVLTGLGFNHWYFDMCTISLLFGLDWIRDQI